MMMLIIGDGAFVYGGSMVTLIDRILRSPKHEEQAYNGCAGILHFCKDVPHRLIQEAVDKCVEVNVCKNSYFKKVLGEINAEVLNRKIENAQGDLAKVKHRYDAATATLKNLLDKRDALR